MYNAKRNFNEATPRRRLLDPTPLDSGAPNVELKLQIPYSVRKRHIYIIGKTQHGKSTLLESIISQDIKNDMGVCVLDPKPSGEKPNLVESILQHIPKERKKDVSYKQLPQMWYQIQTKFRDETRHKSGLLRE